MDEFTKIEALRKEAEQSEKSGKRLKTKSGFIKLLLLIIVFLAIFAGLFYLSNLDLSPAKNLVQKADDISPVVNLDAEMKNRLGSTTFAMENYDEWAKRNGLNNTNKGLDDDPDQEGLPNFLEYMYGTNPILADTDGDKYTDEQEITNGYDPDAPGDTKPIVEIQISKIGVAVPMVWSQSEVEADMLKDLENGVNHYAKTAAPGQNGNTVISGHSSNYIWMKGDYNHVFKDLNNLEKGDVITAKTSQQNGRVIVYSYKVNDKFTAAPDDERIFAAAKDPTLTVATCWPIGTNLKRLIIKADLVK